MVGVYVGFKLVMWVGVCVIKLVLVVLVSVMVFKFIYDVF